MTSLTGRKIGVYQIQALLGSGGMGEVYRARDTRLGRDVAIKVLPEHFVQDPERLRRCEQEARILAALNHPHIGAIYGLEESTQTVGANETTVPVLILELVEGPTLTDRLRSGPIPVVEAITIARQVSEALDAAHEKGIIHRDLKPANVKLTRDGSVKVLDFGLAKAITAGDPGTDLSQPPTTTAGTREGTILGTAAYMSPEQARGQSADKRTDIWSFGCLLFEMLTARRAFSGETVSDTIVSILEREPDWNRLPASTPSHVRDLLRRCLQKDVRLRLRDIGDATNTISAGATDGGTAVDPARVTIGRGQRRIGWIAAALVIGSALTAGGMWMVRSPSPIVPRAAARFVLSADDADALAPSGLDRDVAISPDGSRLVYVAGYPGRGRLVTRAFASLAIAELVGRGSPRSPFFSPDGQWVGFFEVFGRLKKISVTGGAVVDVSRGVGAAARGASWGPDDRIIFSTADPATGLCRVSAQGGEIEVLTRPDVSRGEVDHFWPEVLPGGRAVLFTVVSAASMDTAEIAVLDFATGTRRVLIHGGTHGQYLSTGHILYAARGGLHAVRFDLDRLEVIGEPRSVADDVVVTAEGAVNAAVARDGTLAYVRARSAATARELVWVSRDGRESLIAAPPRAYVYPRISPDGSRAAIEIFDQDRDIWLWSFARESLTRLTDNPGRDGFPVWTPDGKQIIFGSARQKVTNLFSRTVDGTGLENRLTDSQKVQFPYSISPDGARLLFREDDPVNGPDIGILSLNGAKDSAGFIRTPANELNADISPDGRWVAYQSTDSGQEEIYVSSFPDATQKRWQVSTAGGTRPVWARGGRELFYLAPDGLSVVTVETQGGFASGRPTRLLQQRYLAETAFIGRTYDVSPDGQRFLMIRPAGGNERNVIVVVQGWHEELTRQLH